MTKRITIADVAQEAGVSMMTVSRAINNKGGVSEATRQRIVSLAAEMGFQPSGIAQGLATNRTATIGLIVPDVANPFFAQIARGVEDAAHDEGFGVFLMNSSEDAQREEKALDSLWGKQVDGIILCSSRLEQERLAARVRQFQFVVLVNRSLAETMPTVGEINVDDELGAKTAVSHLLTTGGRQKVAYIAGPPQSNSSRQRRAGYENALREHGFSVDASLIVPCYPDADGGYAAVGQLLAAHPDVDGIFAYNDLAAAGVLQGCRENGRSVPDDIAVIGADDIQLASLMTPSLSTLRIDKRGMGEWAMHTLAALIQEEVNTGQFINHLEPELILRDSTPPF